MKRALLDAVRAARQAGIAAVLATPLSAGEEHLADLGGSTPLAEAAREAVRRDASGVVTVEDADWMLTVFNAPLRLIIVGAVHIAQALAPMAALAGFAVTVVDNRDAFATAERFPGVRLLVDWPDDALTALGIDARTAIVTLTHNPTLDDPALETALSSPAFYIGALGSRKTQASRLTRLGERGFDAAALARIHGPAGLAIGAVSPAEVAISILAEAVQCLRAKSPAATKDAS